MRFSHPTDSAFCHSDRSDAQHNVAEESGLERKSPDDCRPDSSTSLRCARNDKIHCIPGEHCISKVRLAPPANG
jgi:hypothetical protein